MGSAHDKSPFGFCRRGFFLIYYVCIWTRNKNGINDLTLLEGVIQSKMSILKQAQEQIVKGIKPHNVKVIQNGFRYSFLSENSKGPCMRQTHIISKKTTLVNVS